MRLVKLQLNTRTLKYPDLQDVYDIITEHRAEEDSLCIDLQGLRCEANGRIIKGSAVSPVFLKGAPHTSLTERHLVFAAESVVHICNGTLVIPPAHALLLSGANVSFNNVCIIGEGLHKFSKDPYLVCVHGANSTATFDNTILESESSHNSNTLVVQRGATCHINGSRVYASDVGNALKVQGGQVFCRKRSLIQGGIFVTSGGNAAPAPQVDRVAAQWHRSKGRVGAAQQQEMLQQQQPQLQEYEQRDGFGRTPSPGPQGGDFSTSTGEDVCMPGPPDEGGHASSYHVFDQQPHDAQQHNSQHQHHHDQQPQQQQQQRCSFVTLRNSEIRGGTIMCIATFGSGSQCDAEGCIIGHGATFGCHAAQRSSVKLVGCEVASSVVGAVVTGAGSLAADKCTIEGGQIGLQTERQGTAHLSLCKVLSKAAPAQAPPLPPPNRPGFLPSFQIQPASVEVRHHGSACRAIDCKMGTLDVGQAEQGVHCVGGGQFACSAGVTAAIEGVKGPFQDFV